MAIIQYDPIIAVMRKHLLENTELVAWEGWTEGEPIICPRYMDTPENMTYPCITIYRDYGVRYKYRTGHEHVNMFIHGWFKEMDGRPLLDDIAYIMNLVVNTLSDNPYEGHKVKEFDLCRLVDSRCPQYEAETRTWFFMTDWKVVCNRFLYETKEE